MNSYRDYIDAQERSYLSQDEKLEKKNTEILTLYNTAGRDIVGKEIQKNAPPKSETINVEAEKHRKPCSRL